MDNKNIRINVNENVEKYLEILELQLQINWYEIDKFKDMLFDLFKAYENNKIIKN